jgi:hypothetical protein
MKGIQGIIAIDLTTDAFLEMKTSVRKRMKNAKVVVDLRKVSV